MKDTKKDTNLEARLNRIEAALGELKKEQEQVDKLNEKVKKASKKFVEKPNLKSAKVFLSELDASIDIAPRSRNAAWTILTVTVVTIMSDDQGD